MESSAEVRIHEQPGDVKRIPTTFVSAYNVEIVKLVVFYMYKNFVYGEHCICIMFSLFIFMCMIAINFDTYLCFCLYIIMGISHFREEATSFMKRHT